MMWAFDAVGVDADFSRRFFSLALKHQLLLRPIGNTVYFMPPYILDDEEIALLGRGALAVFEQVIA
jgi:adenosylmethionine-8-amino-7-oxononanoate aminotransferase